MGRIATIQHIHDRSESGWRVLKPQTDGDIDDDCIFQNQIRRAIKEAKELLTVMARYLILIATTLALLLTTSCATAVTYSGPRLSREEVAFISRHFYFFGKDVCIDEIDGRKYGIVRQFEVLPGPHEVKISVVNRGFLIPGPYFSAQDRYDYYGPVVIRFSAEAGRSYYIEMKELNDGSREVWIEDADNHSVLDKRKTDPTYYMRSWGFPCTAKSEKRNSN